MALCLVLEQGATGRCLPQCENKVRKWNNLWQGDKYELKEPTIKIEILIGVALNHWCNAMPI